MRAFLAAWLIALLSLTNLAAVTHPLHFVQKQSSITLEEYWELVRNTRQTIVQLEADVEQTVRTELDGLVSQWESVSAVELSDKSVIQIDSAFIVVELKTDPPDLEHLNNLLDALLRAHDEYPHKVFTLKDIEPLNEILARPEFQWGGQQSSAAPDWLNTMLESFFNFMERLAFGLQNMLYYGRVPLIIVAVLLFLFSLYYISRSLSRNLVREAQLAADADDGADMLSSRAAMQRAQTLSSQGDYRNAIRYLYLSSLLILDEQGLLRYDRSRTNREYLRSVSSQPQLAGSLRDVIDVFDRVWYGFDSVDEETYQSYVKHVDELREAAMKTLSRDNRVALGVLILLVIVTVVTALQTRTEQQFPRLSTLSSAPNGALALKLWVQELGYGVDEQVLSTFAPPEQASIIFMLEPSPPTESEMDSVDNWVESGGTLIAIGEGYEMFSLVGHYKFFFNYQPANTEAPSNETPLLDSPSSLDLKNVKVNITLGSERNDYVVLSAYQGRPVLVSFELGQGRVILGTTAVSFTNEGLKQEGNPALVLNVLALARAKGDVWFDEWHHGLQNGTQVSGPAEFLRFTPIGRSLLFVTFAVFITFFLQGRGFGRPVPLPQEISRRGALEHVTGIANLNRRAAHRPAVMMYYHNQIKRKLGQRYRLDPAMDDEQYVNTLAGYNPALDKNELLDLLKRLKRRNVSETEMVHLAVEAAKWIDN